MMQGFQITEARASLAQLEQLVGSLLDRYDDSVERPYCAAEARQDRAAIEHKIDAFAASLARQNVLLLELSSLKEENTSKPLAELVSETSAHSLLIQTHNSQLLSTLLASANSFQLFAPK